MIPPASAIVTPQSLHARKARVQETGPVLPRAVRGPAGAHLGSVADV